MKNLKALSIASSKIPVHGVRQLMAESAKIPNAIHLEVGEPNINTPENIRLAATKAMNDEVTHYTANAGLLSLRESLVTHLNTKYNLEVNVNQIAVTAGAVNALTISLLAIVDPGEEVLIPDPSWPNYEIMLSVQGAIPKRYDLSPELEFRPNFDQLESIVTKKTKAILINSPSNPTGDVFSEETIKKLLAFASKHNLYVISDEVYDEIVFDQEHYSVKSYDQEERVISIFSFSKSYAMTGWRVGYAVGSEEVIERMSKLIEPSISCATSFAQKAAEVALEESDDFLVEMRSVYKERRDKAFDLFVENNIRAYKPRGTFYMLVDFSQTDIPSDEFALKLLHEEKVAVGPGETFGEVTKEMIRISLATKEEDLLEGVQRISNFINRYTNITG